jgi:hypothetical protein
MKYIQRFAIYYVRTEGQTDMVKLTGTFLQGLFVKPPKSWPCSFRLKIFYLFITSGDLYELGHLSNLMYYFDKSLLPTSDTLFRNSMH